ncbi:MAG: Holliday junction branch migration protein RuvA [Kiritimatiellae bacterium]|nr:Holliday junction branch migration protein RuvA [Kiritimatiellia bacterium]
MISSLEGRLAEKHPTRIVVVCGGVGYEVHIPLSSHDRLPPVGTECRILTHHHVWADGQALYGFVTEPEREMFRLLLQVSGIGPKTALSALSALSPRDLVTAIVNGDVKRLTAISGVGRKTAERMVVELRDRISKGEALAAAAASPGGAEATAEPRVRDALEALVSLGYKLAEAQAMLAALPPDAVANAEAGELVRLALRRR